MFVYFIVNHVNGKYYVGKTKQRDLQRYWREQRWKVNNPERSRTSKPYLYNAVRKYGWNNFSIHPLITDCQTEEELLHWEQILIKALGAQKYGYNICAGGRGALGWKPSKETKDKISASNRGKHRDRLLSLDNQKRRLAAWRAVLETRNGSFQTIESADKQRAIRANQNEMYRLERWREWESKHGAERRKRAADTHRGTKHKMSPKGHAAISETFKKTAAIRWSTHSLIGQVFNRLTVESEAGRNKRGLIQWNCRCSCGSTTVATTTLLRTGHKKSCGCLARESSIANLQSISRHEQLDTRYSD